MQQGINLLSLASFWKVSIILIERVDLVSILVFQPSTRLESIRSIDPKWIPCRGEERIRDLGNNGDEKLKKNLFAHLYS